MPVSFFLNFHQPSEFQVHLLTGNGTFLFFFSVIKSLGTQVLFFCFVFPFIWEGARKTQKELFWLLIDISCMAVAVGLGLDFHLDLPCDRVPSTWAICYLLVSYQGAGVRSIAVRTWTSEPGSWLCMLWLNSLCHNADPNVCCWMVSNPVID